MEQINLHLNNFEGPFDLLLKLIKVNKMEIIDIRIKEITEQYMAVLRAMEELDLDYEHAKNALLVHGSVKKAIGAFSEK